MRNLRKGRSFERNVSKYEHTHTHEVEQNEDGPSPEVTVEEVWCLIVRDMVKDDHCKCTADLETSQESRKHQYEHRDGTGSR